ncbi:MAG TPA: type II secretion system secretin GspD [Gammaproteobacteria bacterium]
MITAALSALFITGLVAGALTGCTAVPAQSGTSQPAAAAITTTPAPLSAYPHAVDARPGPAAEPPVRLDPRNNVAAPLQDEFRPGTGQLIGSPGDGTRTAKDDNGDITLDFENADIREVVKTILGDLLKKNYAVDPRVQGQITLHTSRALGKDGLIPLLEMLLEMHGAVLVAADGLYQIMPGAAALQGLQETRVGTTDGAGYQLVVVPLQYASAAELQKILKPLASKDGVLQIDKDRNVLLLSGGERELKRLLDTIRIFDVDWMSGMSIGLFSLKYADARTMAGELDAILGQDGNGEGSMVRLITIERLNGLLAITPQPDYLHTVKQWIDRLDRIGEGAGRNLYVYPVQNSKAEHLASLLGNIFTQTAHTQTDTPPQLAPGLDAVTLESDANVDITHTATTPSPSMALMDAGTDSAGSDGVRILADQQRNALVILATAAEYDGIMAALRKLDTVPLQVLVEATIVEVQLTGDLSYGVEWFFKNNRALDNKDGVGLLDLGRAGLAPVVPGFSYSLITEGGDVRAVLNMLESESTVDIISSPSLLVLDNQPAQIRVGDQVPVRTSESTSLSTSGESPIVTSTIEFRDTGVMLNVVPRVNAGGLVIMEIDEEVSTVSRTTTSGIDSPTINQRTISTTVWVQSGQTIVLGGLIRNDKSLQKSGIPTLHKMPLVGPLFGRTDNTSERTELLVMLTPRVVSNDGDASAITQEYRDKVKHIAWPAGAD